MKSVLFIIFSALTFHVGAAPLLAQAELQLFADKLWQRECNKSIAQLTSWNNGEAFPSLGIGHFIWYPVNTMGPYQDTFPMLVAFLQEHKIKIPAWLARAIKVGCPWPDRAAFLADLESARMIELRALLASTVELQAEFVVQRFLKSRDVIIATAAQQQRAHVAQQFDRMAQTSKGLLALIDYVHFKGEGIKETERYAGKGWGLLQVLEHMQGMAVESALLDFIAQAKNILQQRVALSPVEKGEQRWLAGWLKRVDGYAS